MLAAATGEKVFPSRRSSAVRTQDSSRRAVPTIASNTGCTSVGELLITRRMSAVAVWRLKGFLRLVEQARVLDGDHSLVGEGLQQPHLIFGERSDLGAADGDRADDLALAQHRHRQVAAKAGKLGGLLRAIVGIGQHVDDLHRHPLTDRTRGDRIGGGLHREHAAHRVVGLARHAVVRHQMHPLTVEARHAADLGAAKALGALGDDVEHRLNVGR